MRISAGRQASDGVTCHGEHIYPDGCLCTRDPQRASLKAALGRTYRTQFVLQRRLRCGELLNFPLKPTDFSLQLGVILESQKDKQQWKNGVHASIDGTGARPVH